MVTKQQDHSFEDRHCHASHLQNPEVRARHHRNLS